jgi:hypothetical protein
MAISGGLAPASQNFIGGISEAEAEALAALANGLAAVRRHLKYIR